MTVKKLTGIDWDDLRIFSALVRYRSLSATARALGLTHATIARRVKSLEKGLGVQIVERRPDGYQITEAGKSVFESANEIESVSNRLIASLQDLHNGLHGRVRVNAPPSLVQACIVQMLAKFTLNQPALEIDLVGEFRVVSLDRHETDIAIRYGRPNDGDVIAKYLCSVKFSFYGTGSWLEKVSKGESPEFIAFNEFNSHLPEAMWLENAFPESRVSMRTSTQFLQAEAASLGLGIALLPDIVGSKFPALTSINLKQHPPSRELWILRRRVDRNNYTINTIWNELFNAFDIQNEHFDHFHKPDNGNPPH